MFCFFQSMLRQQLCVCAVSFFSPHHICKQGGSHRCCCGGEDLCPVEEVLCCLVGESLSAARNVGAYGYARERTRYVQQSSEILGCSLLPRWMLLLLCTYCNVFRNEPRRVCQQHTICCFQHLLDFCRFLCMHIQGSERSFE